MYRAGYRLMYRRTMRKSFPRRNGIVKKRFSGLYLVRSGGIYLFQIRLPKRIGGGAGARPIRISLANLLGIDSEGMLADDDWPYELTSLVLKGGLSPIPLATLYTSSSSRPDVMQTVLSSATRT
ncbi:hypothetical protein QN219_12605 [Sinorhizobium sp. 7-81]|uniref:hypothetical protein n=1 Tax=Sinorhizobium sp. 8-89 TaxID=3049089 RepID=UPI0024C31FA7|nr:hypothetical protein [Sinorhizobium sp. 8-89]MDK1490900.1 hypothetical protein [Sinorhizobium sp. 8-89]